MNIRRWIWNWLRNDDGIRPREIQTVESSPENGTQISVNKAINGRVLTLRTYRPNSPLITNSNWVTEMYVVKDGESLTDALTMLLMMKGLAE